MSRLAPLAVFFLLVLAESLPAADVSVERLETQKIGDVTYFRVTLKAPADLAVLPDLRWPPSLSETVIHRCGQLPRLAPFDEHTRAVHLDAFDLMGQWPRYRTLRFVGRQLGSRPARLRLIYPVEAKANEGLAGLPGDRDAVTAEVQLDWGKARVLADRPIDKPPSRKKVDLRRDWAEAWSRELSNQHARSPSLGFFRLARELVRKKYGIERAVDPDAPERGPGSLLESLLGGEGDRVFEMTTGATALTESLALERLLQPGEGRPAARTREVKDIRGIDIAEHPWKKMMAGKKPAPELLALLVPHNNWYFTVHEPAAFVSALEVLDAWGGSVLRWPRLLDRDHGIRARYERQLCLPAAEVLRKLPANLVRGFALTGSDLFFLEGSDVTILWDSAFPAAFIRVHDLFLARARNLHGKELKETTEKYRDSEIQGFTTPRREVSLYRTTLGKVVVCSNSPMAIRHVIDTHAGRRRALADSLDFQYMRTVFVRDSKQEDGFAFLSDAFVRRLVGPATRIKERRRQQSRSALQLASQAALFVGMDEGKLPANTRALLERAALKPEMLALPEGKPVMWEGADRLAISEVYNTLECTTPLIELPIDKVTSDEEAGYDRFREEYLRLWRRYFDPVGIRFKLGPEPVRIEVYLLPLVNNSAYNDLRRFAGGGTVRYSPSRIPGGTVLRYLTRLPVDDDIRRIGDWGLLHIDARGLNLERIVHQGIRRELGHMAEDVQFADDLPLLLGVGVSDVKKLTETVRQFWEAELKPRGNELTERKYRGVTIKEAPIRADWGFPDKLYQATLEKGYYLTWNKALLEHWIDDALAQGKEKPKDTVEVNTSLYLAPPGGKNVEAISALLEWETHKRALSAVAAWQALYSAGAVTPRMTPAEKAATARRLLGYIPASPDGTPFILDDKLRQVRNERHGSLSQPRFHARLAPGAGVLELFSQLRSLRADLRFREDGIHTILTLDWTAARK